MSLLVVKRPDMFAFRNPGAMRMPVETALRGGVSDCRNRRLQDMFRYVGLGEQAGSGIPKIQSAWRTQHWRSPEMVEQVEPYEQTIFTLRMASLLPTEVVHALEQRFGAAFDQASEVQKLALVTAGVERSVTHARLRSMTDAHSRDVTLALSSLVQRGLLESAGAHKHTYYFLPGGQPAAEATPVSFELPLPGLEPAKAETGLGVLPGQQESQQESRQESGEPSKSGTLAERVVAVLVAGPRSRSEISREIGHRKVSGQLNVVIKELLEQGLLEHTIPDKPRSRLQKYRLTSRVGENR